MKKKWIIIIGIILIAISFAFDTVIMKFIFGFRNNLLDEFFLGITFVSSEIIIFFFLTSLFLWKEHKRKWVLPLWITLFLSIIISFVLKILVHRQRPYQQNIVTILPVLVKTSHQIWNYSFPSFQSMLAFCAVPILSKEFPKLKYIWISFAVLVASSRVYFGLHFMSDVISGGLIGLIIGWSVISFENKYKLGEKIYKRILKNN
jgi:undecaprenyl-diphosphatase